MCVYGCKCNTSFESDILFSKNMDPRSCKHKDDILVIYVTQMVSDWNEVQRRGFHPETFHSSVQYFQNEIRKMTWNVELSNPENRKTSWYVNVYRIAGRLWVGFTGNSRIHIAKGQWWKRELWCFLGTWTNCGTNNRIAGNFRRNDQHLTSL